MYLFLGGESAINDEEIIGIFDLDTTTVSKKSRDFINNAEKTGKVSYVSYDLPKTFVLAAKENTKVEKTEMEEKVYVTAVSVNTLKKRIQNKNDNE